MFPVLLSTRSHHRRHKVRRPLLSPWLQGLLLAFLLVGSTLALAAPGPGFYRKRWSSHRARHDRRRAHWDIDRCSRD